MRAWIVACMLTIGATPGKAAAEMHVSKVGAGPDFIALKMADGRTSGRLEVFLDHVMPATALPAGRTARLFGEPTEAGQTPGDLGELALPAEGRHLLLISQSGEGRTLAKLLPFDETTLPTGGVQFVNLTSRRMRCGIDDESVELAAGESKRLPTAASARRIVNHRLELKTKAGWKTDSATTLILGANRRFLFVLQEDSPKGPLRRALVTDFDPARNLAPLATPVRAEPPPPDPPAR